MHDKSVKFFRSIYNFFSFVNYMIAAFIACSTPYPVSFMISSTLAWFWWIARKNVSKVKINVSNVLSLDIKNPKVAAISKKIYIEFAKNIVDFFKNGIIPLEQFKKNIKLDGLDNLKKALENGKGAVIFTAHIGNFEWGAARIGAEGIKIWGVGLSRENRFLDSYFERNRKNKCLNTLNANKMLGVFRILKNNEVVAIPTDWDPVGNAKAYDFLGKKVMLPSGAVQIALASGAPLIPSFIIRDGKYHHHQIIYEPIDLTREGEKEKTIEKNMQTIINILEKQIKENIDQWVMFHDIWVKD
ncbi:MAG: lysophospholipid acyltransferase family protein [Actinomycetota bacterium]|nr:lysophospholipid acyltransferase family protein [Actinomycetota bacterium]